MERLGGRKDPVVFTGVGRQPKDLPLQITFFFFTTGVNSRLLMCMGTKVSSDCVCLCMYVYVCVCTQAQVFAYLPVGVGTPDCLSDRYLGR